MLPVLQFVDPVGHPRDHGGQTLPKLLEAFGADLRIAPLDDYVADLPLVLAIEHHDEMAVADIKVAFIGCVVRSAREPEPDHVHRRRSLGALESGQAAELGKSAVATNRQRRSHFVPAAVFPAVSHANGPAVLFDQPLHIRAQRQAKTGILPGCF